MERNEMRNLRQQFIRFTGLFVLLCSTVLGVATAQDIIDTSVNGGFLAYECTFVKDSNESRIQASLHGPDGSPIARESYTLTVTNATTLDNIDPLQVNITQVPQRSPLQMMLLLDVTDTVPVDNIVSAISSDLMPRLEIGDEVALITFSQEITPRTQFYTDKGRLVNEHLIDLLPLDGDNRVYDGLYESIQEFPLSDGRRQIILLVTDSGLRDVEQISVQEIISSADRSNLQIFTVAYFTRDQPDIPEQIQIINGTNGHGWFYTQLPNTRASIERAVEGHFADFVNTLNSEIIISVDMQGIEPDANDYAIFDLTIETNDNDIYFDQIACPIQRLEHVIRFVDDVQSATVNGVLDIGVIVESDLADNENVVVFRANNDVVQDNDSTVYRFDADKLQPGYYNIGAQLLDLNGNILATTSYAIQLYAQQSIALSTVPENRINLQGELTLNLETSAEFALSPADFYLSPAGEPDLAKSMNAQPVAFDNGVASLTIPDIQGMVLRLFPEKPVGTVFAITAEVTGVSPTDPIQATVREPIAISIDEPIEPIVQPVSVIPDIPEETQRQLSIAVPIGLIVFLIIANYLMIRAVGRARIRRLLAFPDAYELSTQVMRITVRRQGVQTAFPLAKKTITIGRGSSNDINLGDDPNISRQHAIIAWRKQDWYFSNRKHRVKSTVNGKNKTGYVWVKLEPIAEIVIGNALIVFHSNTQTDLSEYIKTNI
jgi:hypothetical protein